MSYSQPPSPHFYTSGGGNFGKDEWDVTIFPNNDHEYQEQYHLPDYDYEYYNHDGQQQQQQQHLECKTRMQDRMSKNVQLQQKIAQSMLTQTSSSFGPNNNNNMNVNSEEDIFGIDDIPASLMMNPPPWQFSDNNAASRSCHHQSHKYGSHYDDGRGMTASSAAAPQFSVMCHTNSHNNIMNENQEIYISEQRRVPTRQSKSQARTTTTSTSNNSSNNAPSISSSNKSVTFQTHDQIHAYDEQLDQLKHVDEEFLNVAHFLLDVVNQGSVVNIEDDTDAYFYDEYDGDGSREHHHHHQQQQQGLTPVNNSGRADCTGGGKSILARIFTFQCGTEHDVDDFTGCDGGGQGRSSQQTTMSNNNAITTVSSLVGTKKYKLTKKLVQDFELAVKFRMENIESNDCLTVGGGMESTLVAKTREISRKIEAYGLPGRPPSSNNDDYVGMTTRTSPLPRSYNDLNGSDAFGEDPHEVDYAVVCDEGDDNVRSFDERKRNGPHSFPILPTDDDDEQLKDYDGMDENERHFYNTFGNIPTSKQYTAPKRKSQSPFQSACKLLSSLVGSKTSSTPSEEQCQSRLKQIRREIGNAERMMESSRSNEVISACVTRINKLKEEQRMYQIIQERYKILSMMQTESTSVKKACRQRLRHLTIELESIDLDQYDDDACGDKSKGGTNVARASEVEDHGWYERALQYTKMQHHAPYHAGYVANDENYYQYYPYPKHFSSPRSPRRVLSPRNGNPRIKVFTNHYSPY